MPIFKPSGRTREGSLLQTQRFGYIAEFSCSLGKMKAAFLQIYWFQSQLHKHNMHSRLKVLQSPNSTILSQSDSTTQQHSKRFVRSKSGSRSKSKDSLKDTETRKFFVKNVCSSLLTNQPDSSALFKTLQNEKKKGVSSRGRRPDTPAKEKKNLIKPTKKGSSFQEGLEKELEMLQAQKQLKETLKENERLKNVNKALEDKLNDISLKLAQSINQNCFLQDKLKYFEQKDRESSLKEGRNSALTKIKKIISTKEGTEAFPSFEKLEQKSKELQSDNNRLKEALRTAEQLVQKMRTAGRQMANERQNFLDDLVQQLKVEQTEKEEMLQKMRIQLNIFLVREAKKNDKTDQMTSQEIDNMKKKYVRVLKKYHEVSQELAAFKRKNERMNCLFQGHNNRKNSNDSLTFSP